MEEKDIIKKPYSKSGYTEETLMELMKCADDPLYFIENFVQIQHPMKGAVPFVPYPFQYDLIKAFHEHRFSISLTARQMGKTFASNTIISKNKDQIKIHKLLKTLTFREKIVDLLERWQLRLSN